MAKEVFQLEVQVTTTPALTGLNQIDAKLKQVKDSADKIGKGNSLSGLNTTVNTLKTSFAGLGSVIAGIGFAKIATDAVTAMSQFESLKTTLETVTGSIGNATAAMQLLQSVSAVTPFSIAQLGDSFIKLKAAGIEPTTEQLKLFSDVASVTTDKVGALQAITDLYARTTAGGLGLEEVNRLADRGIPVFDILSKRIGVSRLQISELGKTAEGAQLILRNLEAGLSAQFGGAAARNMNTLNGQFEILKKNINNLFVGAGTGGATSGLTELVKALNQVVGESNGVAQTIGSVLGGALRGVAIAIKFVSDNFYLLITALGLVLLPFTGLGGALLAVGRALLAMPAALSALGAGLRVLFSNLGALTAGLGFFRSAWVVVTEVLGAFVRAVGGGAILNFFSALNNILVKMLGTWGANIAKATGFFYILEKASELRNRLFGSDTKPIELSVADSRRDFRKSENADADAIRNADRQRANELLTGRDAIISKIVKNIEKEIALIGLSKQKAEETNAILEAQAQIRDKLINAGTAPEVAEQQSAVLVQAKAGEIRIAIAKKYSAELAYQMKLIRESTSFEISLLGKSSNEIEKQTKLRETLLSLGIKDTATTKQKQDILEQITKLQDARINDSLSKNLKGIQLETEYLKLSNDERERRIALDQAAADAGFKNAQELSKARPQAAAKISEAVGIKQQTKVDVAARDQIRDLKEESALLSILNEKDRERAKAKQDIYKAIDPEGRGKKINEAQKNEIENLLATIEAQNKLLEVNKKIDDGFATLGDAVSNWALGTEGSIKRVRLALLQLATLQAFKIFGGGVPTGAVGSFLNGVLGGISGARANGGPVDAGKSYLVGEKRPELFVPTQSGYIVPNPTMMNTSTGATHVTLSPNLIIQGSVTGQSELENMFDQFSSAMANETQKFVINQLGQNGILAR